MKVLHINCNYMTTALHQSMIEELDKETDNQVYCPLIKDAKTIVKAHDNVKAVECFNKMDRVLYFVKQDKIFSDIQKHFSIQKFDIIHAYTLMTDGNCAMRLSQRYGVPFVVAVRDTDMNDFFKYKPYLIPRAIRIMEKASRIFFLSETYKTTMLTKYIPSEKKENLRAKMIVVPNGVNSFWLANRIDEETITNKKIGECANLVFAGKIIKRKNIPVLQEAVAILNERGIKAKLTVIGEAIDRKIYEKVLSDSNTQYFSAMPKEQLIEQYRNNHIFCMASLYETFGLVYAEAMSQGLPVLYTKGQGFDGQFPEGVVGYSVECNNPIDIADKMEMAINEYEKLKYNCVNLCNRYDWKKIVSIYKNIYEQVLRESVK